MTFGLFSGMPAGALRLRLVALLLLAALCGCGGGGTATRGTVALSLKFASIPSNLKAVSLSSSHKAKRTKTSSKHLTFTRQAFAGNIPVGTLSVTVNIVNPTTGASLAPQRIITAPKSADGIIPLVTVQFAALPTGPVRVDVAAFPNDTGTGNALATGSVTGNVVVGQTTSLNALMVLTITKLTVTPTSAALSNSLESQSITATATNAAGQVLDLPLLYISSNPDIVDVDANPSDPRQAIIAVGNALGSTQITVVEPNSELTAVVQVTNR